MSRSVDVDVSDLRDFFARMGRVGDEIQKEMGLWLDAVGNEFLRVVQDEIVRREVVDTRLLLDSFEKDNENNVWKLEDEKMTLEVGSSVNYAKYVNDGHWTIDPNHGNYTTLKDGTLARFVPGKWDGDRFVYDPDAKGGMMLRQQWVDGQPYFDSALRIMEKMFPQLLESKMKEWLDKYF